MVLKRYVCVKIKTACFLQARKHTPRLKLTASRRHVAAY
ncbi:hypothetical protein SCH4B_3948 [Ruegeria sp. TrichCH4B]|nr:hypothetical protein SCH4B_3948 [Ruegeria sp. TrichCH4B]